MPNNLLTPAVFLAGLAALCWIGAGYVGASTTALLVVLLIGAFYVAGGLELHRYRQATAALARAVDALTGPVPRLADWLDPLPASLRHAVRQRIEGERAPLPAPALTPYLVGLLVLLGMLGTLLGMMLTLRGTGVALQGAADLDAIRTTLAAPVKGLAFAFGTSIAGVAASAMLGLLSALCRRERAGAVQALDAAIATTLRSHSRVHQREKAFELLQRQVDAMPALVEQLQATMAAIERQSLVASERQVASQGAFHERTEAVHARLAASVEQSLKDSVAESARAAGAALQPVAEATMAALGQHAASLHDTINQSLQRQLDGLSGSLQASTTTVAGLWTDALARQRDSNVALLADVRGSLEQFTTTFDRRSTGLVDAVATRIEAANDASAAAWDAALSRQQAAGEALAESNRQALDAAAARFEAASDRATAAWTDALSQQTALGEALAGSNQQALSAAAATFEAHATTLIDAVQASNLALQGTAHAQAEAAAGLVDAAASRFEAAGDRATAAWTDALSQQTALGAALADSNQRALTAAAATFESHATSMVAAVQQSHVQLQATLEEQTRVHAQETIAEISRLVHDAAEAPKAAAAVIAELRQNLSESMVRDTAMLEERGRLLATVETLLGAVNHASAEQRTAVDAMIATSAEALERVATRFTDHVEARTGMLDAAADRVAAGAIEVASLGDVFGEAVHRFGGANEQLVARLQAIEGALDRSLARSDEQLAYYVAQAREVVDLSVLAQKQIIGELQQLAEQRAAGADAA